MKEIGFHSVKVQLPSASVRQIISQINNGKTELSILLFSGIMFYRPTGQAFISIPLEVDSVHEAPDEPVNGEPIVAILDGVPFNQHSWLRDRLILDDADELGGEYLPGERKHGTAMASLVVHGEADSNAPPLNRPVYFRPIMQPNPSSRGFEFCEHIPDEVFYEDRIARAVRRMFDGEGDDVEAQAPTVRVINLSIGDRSRPFERTLSPCAKLLDWLSWKYNVLFCVSAGNHPFDLDLGVNEIDFNTKSEEEKVQITLNNMSDQASARRILSPAESLNNISIGAAHCDDSDVSTLPRHVDILPNSTLPSPLNCLGYGFRRSVKPEILFPGGKQLYQPPLTNSDTVFKVTKAVVAPGQRVATESNIMGEEAGFIYTRGSSNATALATRATAQIYEVIESLMRENPNKISDLQCTVLLKTLLVHGSMKNESYQMLKECFASSIPSRKCKEFISKFSGYGPVDVDRVLSCTEQRATVIGCGEIGQKQVHEYRFPLPPGLVNENKWRRLIITLAWFSPINTDHRYLRKAKLSFEPPKKSGHLNLERIEADHHQVKRGTIQHEILASEKVSDYQDGDYLVVPVQCRADAIENLDDQINYAIAVTLEVKEDIDIEIYQEIKTRIQPQIQV